MESRKIEGSRAIVWEITKYLKCESTEKKFRSTKFNEKDERFDVFQAEFQEAPRLRESSPEKIQFNDDILEPISGARTSTGLCNINIYDSFTKLI